MKKFLKNYAFIIFMLLGIVAGCVTGAVWPKTDVSAGATVLEPLGTLFINMMFCIVVPMVFCSIASAVANMDSAKRAGKLMGTTLATFCTTAAIAALIMYVICRIIPLGPESYKAVEGAVDDPMSLGDLVIGFFIGLSAGAGVVVSQAYGAGDNDRLHKAVHTGMAISLVSAVVIGIIGVLFARTFLG